MITEPRLFICFMSTTVMLHSSLVQYHIFHTHPPRFCKMIPRKMKRGEKANTSNTMRAMRSQERKTKRKEKKKKRLTNTIHRKAEAQY